MIIKNFIVCSFLCSSSFFYSQTLGAKGGLNISSLSNGFDFKDTQSKAGFYAGIFINIPIKSTLNFQPELLYNKLGAKVEYEKGSSEYEKKLDYISLPLMIQYNILTDLYLEAGPQLSFLINAKEKYTALNGEKVNAKIDKDFLNTFDFGLGIGAGYYFTPKLAINARYTAGFTDLYKYNDGKSVKNNAFQLGLTYKFK